MEAAMASIWIATPSPQMPTVGAGSSQREDSPAHPIHHTRRFHPPACPRCLGRTVACHALQTPPPIPSPHTRTPCSPPFPIFHFFATFALPKWIAVPKNESLVAKNRKASFLYELLDTYTAGLVLTGTEIKSLRMGKANLVDAYCLFLNGELWVRGLHIPEYSYGTHYNHNPDRERKLLLNRKELNKLERGVKAKGMTIVATRLFIGERGYAKLVIALARGKQAHDKRDTLKQRDADRELRQAKYRRR